MAYYRYGRSRRRRRRIANATRFSVALLAMVLVVGGLVWGIVALATGGAARRQQAQAQVTPTPPISSPAASLPPSGNQLDAQGNPIATPTVGGEGDDVTAGTTAQVTPTPTPDTTNYVPYKGFIEHVFVHPLVVYPELAFDGDAESKGMDDYMTTVGEFRRMLEELYENDYILIYFDQAYGFVTDENGNTSYERKELLLPEGKKPVVISTDDINYYKYMTEEGCNHKLVVGPDGHIAEMSRDPATGQMVTTQGNEVFSIVNQFLEEHPDFSHQGAKCYVGVTGYAGILGYRTQADRTQADAVGTDRQAEIEAVKPVIQCLKNDGFKFASHSYAHANMSKFDVSRMNTDCTKWRDEVQSLIGETDVFLFPYGAWPEMTGEVFQTMVDYGFRHFSGVGIAAYNKTFDGKGGYAFDDRKNIDGLTMRSCIEEGPNATKADGSPTSRSQVWKMMDVEYVFELSTRGSTPGQGIGAR